MNTTVSKPVSEEPTTPSGVISADNNVLTRETVQAFRKFIQRERTKEQAVSRTEAELVEMHKPVTRRGSSVGKMEFAASFGEMGRGSTAAPKGVVEAVTQPATRVVERLQETAVDAYFATYDNPVVKEFGSETTRHIMEVVIGTDERVRIEATDQYPWRCICSLRIKAADGRQFIGTGWLVSPRVVVTAGHCVYMHSAGGWADEIEVIPGRNSGDYPHGSAICTQMSTVNGWVNDQDTNSDYGVIILPENKRFGDQLGWIGFSNRSNSELENTIVNLAGYPGDKPSGTLWFDNRELAEVHDEKLYYVIDTAGGQSGAPVWQYMPDGTRHGCGIHTSGHLSGNSATRINDAVFNNIVNWIGEAP